jgi:hypothetical protein
MRPIDKFILHAVHNLFPLNEYSEGELNKLMAQFREEADDLGIEITDEQLKAYIQRFDALKNSPKITDKDLRKYTLSKLIRLITASPGGEEEKIDDTPDVVYHEEPYIIWNGSKEGNCIRYGKGEKWCITRGSFSNYRYNIKIGYPVFYLAKNNSLSDDDKLSFVAIQVRDTKNDNERYVYTNRRNLPYESSPMSWEQLNSEIPWLSNIPNVKNIMKYIPLSNPEKITQKYKYDGITVREWMKFPFETKKQYLVVRGNKDLFNDINNNTFISKYLPKYPQIANFIAITPTIIDYETLLSNLDTFSNQDRRSIIANLRDKLPTRYLGTDIFSWDVKKLLTSLNKWNTEQNTRIYITKDGSAIIKLDLDDDIKVGLYTEEDDYPNIKLNQRTSKYLLDYPELDKIPLKNLLKLISDNVISRDVIDKILEKAKKDPNSAIIVKSLENGDEVILDTNTFSAYKAESSGIQTIPFSSEEVQSLLADSTKNTSLQLNALTLLRDDKEIPRYIDKDTLISVLKSIPLNDRIIRWGNTLSVVLVTPNNRIIINSASKGTSSLRFDVIIFHEGRRWSRSTSLSDLGSFREAFKTWYEYLATQNLKYNDVDIIRVIKDLEPFQLVNNLLFAAIAANPPMAEGSLLVPKVYDNKAYIVNTQNPRESYVVSSNRGKLNKANISPSNAATILGNPVPVAAATTAATGDTTRRRGRPAGVANAPRQPAAPEAGGVAGGDVNVRAAMEETGLLAAFFRLPTSMIRRLNVANASRVDPNGDRGVARRNNMLGPIGRVSRTLSIGASKIYFIRLANQQIIASINVQPGNSNFLLFGNESIGLNSPSDLVQVLTQRGLAEHRNYLVREFLNNYPEHKNEVRNILKQHLNK